MNNKSVRLIPDLHKLKCYTLYIAKIAVGWNDGKKGPADLSVLRMTTIKSLSVQLLPTLMFPHGVRTKTAKNQHKIYIFSWLIFQHSTQWYICEMTGTPCPETVQCWPILQFFVNSDWLEQTLFIFFFRWSVCSKYRRRKKKNIRSISSKGGNCVSPGQRFCGN